MRDGEIRPTQCKVNEETGERKAKVLPDEFPGEDRIPEQLMYVPPEGFIPENMDDPDVPLKTIVLWNGVGSWGGLRPGRGVFLKEKCPVSSCVISSNRIDGPKADLVIFKVSILLFLLPDNKHLTKARYNFGYCIFSPGSLQHAFIFEASGPTLDALSPRVSVTYSDVQTETRF